MHILRHLLSGAFIWLLVFILGIILVPLLFVREVFTIFGNLAGLGVILLIYFHYHNKPKPNTSKEVEPYT